MYFPIGVIIPEPIRFEANSDNLAGKITSLRKVTGIYTLTSAGAPLHLSWSTNLERRLNRLLLLSYPGRNPGNRALAGKLDSVECWPTGSRLELALFLYRLAKKIYPERYLQFLHLRLPWFLGFRARDPFPRLEVMNRSAGRAETLWGPFPSRASAQQYEQEVLSLFQIRRCTDSLLPSPEHPGCIYGEMNQCLRPCQCVVSKDEYAVEAGRVQELLRSNGRAAVASLSAARDRACEETHFEEAALIHKRVEKIKAAAALRPAVIDDLDRLSGVALTRSAIEGRFNLWPMLRGCWQEPLSLEFLAENSPRTSLDTQLRELLASRLAEPSLGGNRIEELAVFSRWYFSSWRDGEWFPFVNLSDLNYRKLVREVSRLAHASSIQPS